MGKITKCYSYHWIVIWKRIKIALLPYIVHLKFQMYQIYKHKNETVQCLEENAGKFLDNLNSKSEISEKWNGMLIFQMY